MENSTIYDGDELFSSVNILEKFSVNPSSLRKIFTKDMISLLKATDRVEYDNIEAWVSNIHQQTFTAYFTPEFLDDFRVEICLRVFDAIDWIVRVEANKFTWVGQFDEDTAAGPILQRVLANRERHRRIMAARAAMAGIPDSD